MDGFTPDKETALQPTSVGDHIQVGNIQHAQAVAIGAGATAVYQGLTVEDVAVLVAKLKRVDQPKVWDGRIPYLGLSAFRESDAQFFFGRESLVDDLLERVQQSNFITIAGPSGSGKSSVARAGLFHALRRGRLPKSDKWPLATMQPRGEPLGQLAAAIERLTHTPGSGNHIRQHGLTNPLALHEQIQALLSDDPGERFVLLVDQFEETFTQTKDEATQGAFIQLLTAATQAEGSRTIILMALRSDFISHCARYPDLRDLMSQQFQLVGAMEPSDLAKAITLPSLEVGATIDPALVSRIMSDMKGEPGALPLMSFALRDLFEAEKSAKGKPMDLTLPEYLQRGGIESALERHANKVFDDFTPEQQMLARGVFSKLIEVGQGRADTRRTAVFSELVSAGTQQEAVETVVNALAQEKVRLITTDGEDGNRTVTVAHEKLIDAWPWLRRLVDENREMIALKNQIQNDAKAWDEKKDAGFLYRGGRLIQVEEQLDASSPDLNELSQRFIQASLGQRQQEIEKEAAQQRQKLEQAQELAKVEQKRSALFRRALIGGGVLVLFLLIAMVFAWVQTNNAQKQTAVAQSRSLAISSLTIGQKDAMRALLLAIAAGQQADTALAFTALDTQLPFMPARIQTLSHESAVNGAAWNGDESQILTWGTDGTVVLWDATSGARLQALSHEGWVNGAAWNGDETQILTWSEDETAVLWDATSGARLQTLVHEDWVYGAIWNGDESQILTLSEDETVVLWDATSGARLQTLSHEDWVNGATWNGDESRILTWSRDGTAVLWDATSGAVLQTLPHEGWVNGTAWNGGESQILTWSRDGTAVLWDATSGARLQTLSHEGEVNGAAWNRGESRILTWSRDGTVVLWDATSGARLQTLIHEDWVYGATWNGDESQILTWSRDGTAVLWGATSGARLQTLSQENEVYGAAWNGDESQILTWSDDGTAVLWDATSGARLQTLSHENWVYGAAWNAGGSQILTWSLDGTAKIWNSQIGQPLHTISPDGTAITAAKWNQNEDRLLVTTWGAPSESTTRIWTN